MTSTIKIKGILDEDFQDYCKPSMLIATAFCDWKCCIEAGIPITVCQNEPLAQSDTVEYSIEKLVKRYMDNHITKAIIFGGLEPMLQFDEMLSVINCFRKSGCNDDIIIYTGYYKHEIEDELFALSDYDNIIVKFGRFVPNSVSRFDEVLGITLASDNQYAVRLGT